MKRFIFSFIVCFSVVSSFAQSAAQYKNDGNAAIKSKDYKKALENYEKFLAAEDTTEDPALVFNTGYCAMKIDEFAKAEKYFGQSIASKYKLSNSYYYQALAQKSQDKFTEMISTLNAGIAACPTKNSKMVSMLAKHFLLEGQEAQKSDKFEDAENLYSKAAKIKSNMQADALFSLGTLYYNKGAKIMQAATPIANAEPDKYKAESETAKLFFKKAMDELAKAKAIAPTREDISSTMNTIQGLLN